jgi:hypothetical protein
MGGSADEKPLGFELGQPGPPFLVELKFKLKL